MQYWGVFFLGLILINFKVLAKPYEIDKIIAIVNHEIILKSDLEDMIKMIKMNNKKRKQNIFNYYDLHNQVLNRLIINNIILQLAKQLQINFSKEEINSVIMNISHQNNLTIKEMEKKLSIYNIKMSKFFDEIRKEMLISKVYNDVVGSRIKILSQEVNALTEQISLQANRNMKIDFDYIIILLPEELNQEKLKNSIFLSKKILSDFKNGYTFNQLINTYTKNNEIIKTGKINSLHLKDLPVIFAEKLKDAKKGDVIGPIRSSIGYNILRINNISNKKKSFHVITEVKIRNILIKSTLNFTDEQIKDKLIKIHNDINSKKISFSDAAKQNSEDFNSSFKGGDLGWNALETYDPIFRTKLLKLKKGELSKPFFSDFGWHLIQLDDIRTVNETDSVYKQQAYNLLFNSKFNEEVENWTQELRINAYVKIINDYDN
ncbi:Chaperone SurA [Candidatus Providencia siddallii]|uniref:Chaperone SurA n=1 Tax=Candidatus Providencia siddallii TaxID=1715285 RepID=A0A0M6W6Z5_9GAMM|nr:Chaperone SurA [Candidatus Providencia siddallii]